MLRQKFRYDGYEQLLKQREYSQAQGYCSSFPKDQNAVICGWYAQYFLLRPETETSFLELDAAIRSIHWDIKSKGQQGYDKNALYLLGILLFERGFEREGDYVLKTVSALKKTREKLSEAEKNARIYRELHYFQKWENSHQMEDLEEAADCYGHSEICYLYADMVREKGGRQDVADGYEFLYAVDYCAVRMDKATYNRNHIESYLDQVRDDIRKDIGFIASDMAAVKESLCGIESHLEAMVRKIDALPEAVCASLHQEFGTFRAQISGLSEQIEDQEETVCSLVEKAQALDLEVQDSRDAMLELKALAEQISAAGQDREDRLTQSINGLKNAILENNNLLLQEIVDEAAAEIDSRFHGRLSKAARDSIVTALFTLNFYKELNEAHEPLVEYSGVVILAASALEIEIHERLYEPFGLYIQEVHKQTLQRLLHKDPRYHFTLGSFGFVVGIRAVTEGIASERNRLYKMFNEFVQDNSDLFSSDPRSLFQCGPDGKLPRKPLEDFAGRLRKLSNIRNDAAHIKPITLERAEEACQLAFLSPQERAGLVANESISLLELLLKSCTK
ncbi:MAG: hypothetical protein K2O18_18470 [Oscillospiraceae bacterium]|nr:hypothetical protein [Oscillospiraceae bacterium]